MDQQVEQAGPDASAVKPETGVLSYREATEKDLGYVMGLAYRQIGIIPRRLKDHKTFLVYQDNNRIGFITYCRVDGENIYIYMLALEKKAQNKGHANDIGTWVINRELKEGFVKGLKIRIQKKNQAGYTAALKSGYKLISELPRHYELYRLIDYRNLAKP